MSASEPVPEVKRFLAERRKETPELVKDAEASIALDGRSRPDSPLRP